MNNSLKQFLSNRFLNGYTIVYPKYEEILVFFINKLKKYRGEDGLALFLNYHLGPYNDLTAKLYLDICKQYLIQVKHKNPSLEEIYDIISYDQK